MSELKKYLGDGVYADCENGMIKLTTENGIEATNEIYLEPEVMEGLAAYYEFLKRHFEKLREAKP